MPKKKPDKILFDGTRVPDTISRDPKLYCGYNPKAEGRCGRPTLDIIAYGKGRGFSWLPICKECQPVAKNEQGEGFDFYTRYKDD